MVLKITAINSDKRFPKDTGQRKTGQRKASQRKAGQIKAGKSNS